MGQLRYCHWPGCMAPITGKGNIKYCHRHRQEAQRERWRKDSRLYYQKNRKRKKLSQPGTFTISNTVINTPGPSYLGVYIPHHNFYKEYEVIQKLKPKVLSKTLRTKYKENRFKTPYQYVTEDDYHYFNVNYTLAAPYTCPYCE